jgi:ABC-type transport system involved in multi-copper enzyme maturation permease subunit
VTGSRVDGQTRPRLVIAELRKARTTNLWWILSICALAAVILSLLVNGAFAQFELSVAQDPTQSGRDDEPDFIADRFALEAVLVRHAANIYTSGQYFGLLLVMLFGILMVTNEFQHQTASSTFLATPRRSRVIAAKLLTVGLVAGVAWLVTTLIDVAAGVVYFSVQDQPNSLEVWSVQRSVAMNLLAYAIWAVLGAGLGALIRSQVGATITGVAVYTIAGQIIPLVALVLSLVVKQAWVIQLALLAPSFANQVMISPERIPLGDPDGTVVYAPQWWVAALVLLGYGAATATIGTIVLRHRDIS